MRTSDRGIDLIVHFEGLIPYAYNDPAGHATFGVGHLLHPGPCTAGDLREWGSRQSPKRGARGRALRVLRDDLDEFERGVTRLVRGSGRGTKQREFDAMVSLAFNVGLGAFASSTVRREHKAGHPVRAGAAFMLWVLAGGDRLLGLVRRRRAERRMYRGKRWR